MSSIERSASALSQLHITKPTIQSAFPPRCTTSIDTFSQHGADTESIFKKLIDTPSIRTPEDIVNYSSTLKTINELRAFVSSFTNEKLSELHSHLAPEDLALIARGLTPKQHSFLLSIIPEENRPRFDHALLKYMAEDEQFLIFNLKENNANPNSEKKIPKIIPESVQKILNFLRPQPSNLSQTEKEDYEKETLKRLLNLVPWDSTLWQRIKSHTDGSLQSNTVQDLERFVLLPRPKPIKVIVKENFTSKKS